MYTHASGPLGTVHHHGHISNYTAKVQIKQFHISITACCVFFVNSTRSILDTCVGGWNSLSLSQWRFYNLYRLWFFSHSLVILHFLLFSCSSPGIFVVREVFFSLILLLWCWVLCVHSRFASLLRGYGGAIVSFTICVYITCASYVSYIEKCNFYLICNRENVSNLSTYKFMRTVVIWCNIARWNKTMTNINNP